MKPKVACLFLFAACFLLFLLFAIFRSIYWDRLELQKKQPNHHVVERNLRGRIILEETMTNGLLHGPYFLGSVDGLRTLLKGQYFHGVCVDKWEKYFPNGKLESEIWYSEPYENTNRTSNETVKWETDILHANYYYPDGKLLSTVRNGIGVKARIGNTGVFPDSAFLSSFETVGYNHNYEVHLYPQDVLGTTFPYATVHDRGGNVRCRFYPNGTVAEIIQQVSDDQWNCREYSRSREKKYSFGDASPPFLEGKPIIIPSYKDGILRFNVSLTCTNLQGYVTILDFPAYPDIRILEESSE